MPKANFYVDPLVWSHHWKRHWCHLATDGTEDDLLLFAELVGVERRHLQKSGTEYVHFDLTERLRTKAIQAGALPVSARELSLLCVVAKRGKGNRAGECAHPDCKVGPATNLHKPNGRWYCQACIRLSKSENAPDPQVMETWR